MLRARAKYASAIAAAEPPNSPNGTHRNHRLRSQRRAYQLQKTPSAIGSAKAPNPDSPLERANLPSAKSVANATTDTLGELETSEGSRARSTLSRFGHP